jgi:hypothetical protein
MPRPNGTTILAACLGLIAVFALAAVVLKRQGNLAWDDADYLRRGLRIANRAVISPIPPLRAMGDLLRERPKPPLLVAWVALSTVIMGRTSLEPLIVAGSVGPFALLLAGVFLTARRQFGPEAPLPALLATLASGLVLSLGAKVMVETFLALTILLALHGAALVLERPTMGRGIALGVAIGLAMLAKLTVALLLSGPAVVFGVLLYRRYGNSRTPYKVVASSLVGVMLVAGPWYVKNGRAAVEFARFSSRYQIEAEGRTDRVDTGARVRAYAFKVTGWPNLAVLGLALAGLFLARQRGSAAVSSPPTMGSDFAALATAGLVAGAIGLLVPSYFDPRFLAPIWPSFAVVLGGLVMKQSPRLSRFLAIALLLAGSIEAFVDLVREPGTRTYWAARELIDELVTRHRVKLIGNVGNTGDWNVCKTGMMNETRPHPDDCFVLHDLSRTAPETLAARLAKLDAVVVLKDSDALTGIDRVAPGLNRTRTLIDPTIQSSGRFQQIATPGLTGLPPMSVYVRK